LHTGNSIIINAPRTEIFPIVSDLERWPEHLPHYRYVRITGRDGARAIAEMSACRGSIPVSWVSAYEADPDAMELHFEHLTKWTKGMIVTWTLTPTRDATRVEIAHHLKFRIPMLGWLVEPVIGNFISHIASRTLAEFKKLIEARRSGTAGRAN
jgi:ribosome-associated toxin RatA of RatAB toxin-antitoxin module